MIDLYELRQLTAFADLGTLSKVAEEFHISTPSVTRSMQHLEDAFGVPLFIRGKNRIELNDTGNTAVEYARKLLAEAEQAVAQVRAFDQFPFITNSVHHFTKISLLFFDIYFSAKQLILPLSSAILKENSSNATITVYFILNLFVFVYLFSVYSE